MTYFLLGRCDERFVWVSVPLPLDGHLLHGGLRPLQQGLRGTDPHSLPPVRALHPPTPGKHILFCSMTTFNF